MNTKHTHQIRTATVATVVAFVACASTAAPAFASTPMAAATGLWNQQHLAVRRADRGSRRNDAGGVHQEAPRRQPPHPHRGVTRPACPEQDTAPDIGRGPCLRFGLAVAGAARRLVIRPGTGSRLQARSRDQAQTSPTRRRAPSHFGVGRQQRKDRLGLSRVNRVRRAGGRHQHALADILPNQGPHAKGPTVAESTSPITVTT